LATTTVFLRKPLAKQGINNDFFEKTVGINNGYSTKIVGNYENQQRFL
jgi:hypothetical protein